MKLKLFAQIAGTLALTLGLAGCIDMTTDVQITSATTAKAVVTQTMGAEIYPTIKAGDDNDFCVKDGEVLTENADGSATCVITSDGAFADLKFDDGGATPVFTANPDGTVRVAIKTEGMMGELGSGDDPQAQAMLKQMFDGHFVTIRLGGNTIVDTNLTKTPDGKYGEVKIAFLDLINGTAELPEELYAVIRP